MEVFLTDNAKEELMKLQAKNYRIDVVNNGWAGPIFGLVQGEPREEDIVINVGDINFAVEDYYQEVFNKFDIDYSNSLLRKGFVIYPEGQSSRSC